MTTEPSAFREALAAIEARHVRKETYDRGSHRADPDGYVRYCAVCHWQKWPCEMVQVLAINAALAGQADSAAIDMTMERDMAEAYCGTLERHLRQHGCDHDFSEVANENGIAAALGEQP